jgi:hypothetical protein
MRLGRRLPSAVALAHQADVLCWPRRRGREKEKLREREREEIGRRKNRRLLGVNNWLGSIKPYRHVVYVDGGFDADVGGDP